MILKLTSDYAPDAVERDLPDPLSGRAVVIRHRPDVVQFLADRHEELRAEFGDAIEPMLVRADAALTLSLARFGCRHGSWGEDFHHYHNENHALEILDGRIGRLMQHAGLAAMTGGDWIALSLFATCHDLRQREQVDFDRAVGNNEAASIAETFRILDASGFDRDRDRRLYLDLELMIAGSTFDARPAASRPRYNSAEAATTGGALASRMEPYLDQSLPGWREDADIVHAVELGRLASDLDTANVAEEFPWLAESASRLCQEREMRSERDLRAMESAGPCLGFLSSGQERYFFELHRFCSPLGEATFASTKAENAAKVRALSQALQARFTSEDKGPPTSGLDVVREFSRLTLAA